MLNGHKVPAPIGPHGIPTWISGSDLTFLKQQAEKAGEKAVIVELRPEYGGSTAALRDGNKTAKIYCVREYDDIPHQGREDGRTLFQILKHNLDEAKANAKVINANDKKALTFWSQQIDLLVIHRADAHGELIHDWIDHVKDGGLIVFRNVDAGHEANRITGTFVSSILKENSALARYQGTLLQGIVAYEHRPGESTNGQDVSIEDPREFNFEQLVKWAAERGFSDARIRSKSTLLKRLEDDGLL